MTDAAPHPRETTPERLSGSGELRGFAAIVAASLVVFVGACGLLHLGYYEHGQLRDTTNYWVYGAAAIRGYVPYRDYRIDYPPGALPIFILPAIGHDQPAQYPGYRGIFEWMMVGAGCIVIVLMSLTLRTLGASTRRLAAALGFVAVSPLLTGSIVLSHYDLYAAIFAAGGLLAMVKDRGRTASVVLAIGTVTKLYPVLLLPLALADIWRRHGRREAARCAGLFAAVIAVVMIPFTIISPGGVRWMLSQQLTRPLQIETLGSAFLLVGHDTFGIGVKVATSHGSYNLAGSLPDAIGTAQSLLLAAVLIGLWVAYARGVSEPERLVQYVAAVVCAYVALGKVLSPQYLIWLVAVVPLVRGRRGLIGTALLAFAFLLTQLWYPHHYVEHFERLDAHTSYFVLERDLVLVALLVVLTGPGRWFAEGRSPGPDTAEAPSSGVFASL